MRGRQLAGVGLTVASACGFGSGALFAKTVYDAGVDWHSLMAWRFLLGAALGWAWILLMPAQRAALGRIDRRAVVVAILLGVMYTGNSGTYYAALETVPASLGALIVYFYPALVAVLTLRVGRRLEGPRAWGALGLATGGVILAVGNIDAAHVPPTLGLVLMVVSPIIYAFWIVLSARLSGERRGGVGRDAPTTSNAPDPLVAGAIMLSATAVTYWSSALAIGRRVLPSQIPPDAWPGVLGVGVLATFVAVLGFYAGAHRIGAARAALISTVEPIWTISLAWLLFGQALTPLQLVGGAMILVGVLIAQTGPAAPATLELRLADE